MSVSFFQTLRRLTSRLARDLSSESKLVSAELNRLIRAFGLLWRGLGSARVYVVALAGVVMILAAIGIWHLVSSSKPNSPSQPAIAGVSPGAKQSLVPTAPFPGATPAEGDRQVEITKIEQTEKRGPHGEDFVVATIGLASRTNVEKSALDIHVYFYDLTADNELRPTDAQVTYQWLTPVRDWSDPAPKYLAATYFKPPVPQRSLEKLHYGGCVVRVFSSGKLQDEQSKPEGLVASLRRNAAPSSNAPDTTPFQPPAFSPQPFSPSSEASSPIPPSPARPPPMSRRSPDEGGSPSPVTDHSSESLPSGKPIPGKPGFLYSPYDPKFIIDVRGFPPGTLVNDPNTNKPFRVP